MKKKIIICCDGTWNSPDQSKGGRAVPTNVVKLVRALKPVDSENITQVIYYDQGVGTGTAVDKLIGGATGYGISQNILDCYRFLANNYTEGDDIYCFGFSRGAYTARVVAGLVAGFGLLSKQNLDKLPNVYQLSRIAPEKRAKHKLYQEVESLKKNSANPRFKFIGVWDTVGALGAPTPLLGWITRQIWVRFHDTRLNNIDYAYHALAIDERRKPFRPSVWTHAGDSIEMKQVWFSGAHNNIGGGYPDADLSDLAFEWMVKMAKLRGLDFNQIYSDDREKVNKKYKGKLEDSYSFVYKILGEYLRPIGQLHDDPAENPKKGINERMHQSVKKRNDDDLITYNPKNNKYGLDNLPIES